MEKPPIRRLTLADLVILVASLAVGFSILRYANEARAASLINRGISLPLWPWMFGLEIFPFVMSTAAGLLVARLLPPRPCWRRLFRQPGMIASLTLLSLVVVSFSLRFFSELIDFAGRFYTFDSHLNDWMFAGRGVALAWTILALAGVWRAEPSWIDRAGRGLGILVIVLWLAFALST